MAKKPQNEQAGEVQGRALVDIPSVNAKCGDYITLPASVAGDLAQSGQFDAKAVKPD